VSIVQEVIEHSRPSLQREDWDRLGTNTNNHSSNGNTAIDTDESKQCEFMSDVVRGVTAMHKVLQQQLPPEQLSDVFCRIFMLLNRKVRARTIARAHTYSTYTILINMLTCCCCVKQVSVEYNLLNALSHTSPA
jgi:hypothetical protein